MDGVVVVHQVEGGREGAVAAGVADGRHQQREVAGAVGEDAQVAVQLAPEDPQAVAPGEKLRERVVGQGLGEGGEVAVEAGLVGQFNRPKGPGRERVIVHRSDGFLLNIFLRRDRIDSVIRNGRTAMPAPSQIPRKVGERFRITDYIGLAPGRIG